MKRTGLLHLYYGDGKGKTTAAMGLALRAMGSGKRVVILQFLKGGKSGEVPLLEQLGARVNGSADDEAFYRRTNEAIPQDAAILQRHVQRDHGHAQLLGFGGQDVGRRIGENTDHKIPPDFR